MLPPRLNVCCYKTTPDDFDASNAYIEQLAGFETHLSHVLRVHIQQQPHIVGYMIMTILTLNPYRVVISVVLRSPWIVIYILTQGEA